MTRSVVPALARTTRPLSSLVAGTLAASVLTVAQGRLSFVGLAAGAAMTILAMFGFVVNDVVDHEKDAKAGLRRPIATGELSRRAAVLFAAVLLPLVFVVSPVRGAADGVLAAASLGLLVYSPLALRFPAGKGVYVATLCCAPLLYGSTIAGVQRSWPVYAALAAFIAGREIWMDADEMEGDRRAGVETIAALLGQERTRRTGVALMLLSAAFLVAIERDSIGRIAALAMLCSFTAVLFWPGLSDGRRIQLSRFPMLIGAVALACGES
ncbi:MAG: UbiA family prenyltransferase [Candidatus Solibacter usitatus]|nr:UbiA family prenyltransferase [Candidatus Solibacter usitatus]